MKDISKIGDKFYLRIHLSALAHSTAFFAPAKKLRSPEYITMNLFGCNCNQLHFRYRSSCFYFTIFIAAESTAHESYLCEYQ